jgi:hypothetical protein
MLVRAGNFEAACLIAEDFDNTVALTNETSPKGLDVNETYRLAIDQMFGLIGLEQYEASGGLHNRAPIQVVRQLAVGAEGQELDDLTSKFTETKLSILLGEVGAEFPDGRIWPRPTEGYLDFMQLLEQARGEGHLVNDLILSSGHEAFINKTFEAWGFSKPDFVIAEETIRRMNLGLPVDQIVKPSPVLMDIARDTWRSSYGINESPDDPTSELSRIIYVGDDPTKDGLLAHNSGVEFALISPNNALETWKSISIRMLVGLGDQALSGALKD